MDPFVTNDERSMPFFSFLNDLHCLFQSFELKVDNIACCFNVSLVCWVVWWADGPLIIEVVLFSSLQNPQNLSYCGPFL